MSELDKLMAMRAEFDEIKAKLLGLEKRGRFKSLVFTKIEEAVHWFDDLLREAEIEEKQNTNVNK